MVVKGAERDRAELLHGVGGDEVRATVHRVDRLPLRRVAREQLGEADVGLVERFDECVQRVLGDAGVGHAAPV